MSFVDTDVMVDYLRGSPAAAQWFGGRRRDSLEIPAIAAMELVAGCRNRTEQVRLDSFLSSYTLSWPDEDDFREAYGLLAAHHLRSGVSIPDCLMAAMSIRRSQTLYSFNLKHFRQFSHLIVKAPYRLSSAHP